MRAVAVVQAVAVAVVLLALAAQPIVAQRDVRGGDGAALFDRLDAVVRGSIEERHQHSFLVQLEHAREAALPPNPCKKPNFGPLGAFENHVNAQTGKQVSEDGAREMRGLIGDIRQLPPNPCEVA